MATAERVAKNTLYLYMRMGITIFISLYATRIIIAALGADDFGLYNLIGGTVALFSFFNSTMAAATQRFLSHAQGEGSHLRQKQIFNASIVFHTSIGFLIVIILFLIMPIFFDKILNIDMTRVDAAKSIYFLLILNILTTIIFVPYEASIIAHENMFLIGILGVLESILRLIIAFSITGYSGDKLIAYSFLMALLTLIIYVIKLIFCHIYYSEVRISIVRYYNKSIYKELLSFSSWSLIGSTIATLTNRGQDILLNYFFGTKVNAAQGVGRQIAGQLNSLSVNMLKALNPVIVKSDGAKNSELMLKATFTGSKLSFYLLAMFAIPFIMEMPYIFNIWLKNVPEYAVIFAQLIIIRNLITQLFVTLTSGITATGKIKGFQLTSSVLATLPLIITYFFFVNGYEPFTIYFIFIITTLLRSFGPILFYSKRNFDLPIKSFLLNVVLSSLVVVLIPWLLALVPHILLDYSLIRLLAVFICYLFFFICTSYFIGLNSNEREQLFALVKKMKKKIKQ